MRHSKGYNFVNTVEQVVVHGSQKGPYIWPLVRSTFRGTLRVTMTQRSSILYFGVSLTAKSCTLHFEKFTTPLTTQKIMNRQSQFTVLRF